MLKLAKSALVFSSVTILLGGLVHSAIKSDLQPLCTVAKVGEVPILTKQTDNTADIELLRLQSYAAQLSCWNDSLINTVTFNKPVVVGSMLATKVPNNR